MDYTAIAYALIQTIGWHGKRILTRTVLSKFNSNNTETERVALRSAWALLGVGEVTAERLRGVLRSIDGKVYTVGKDSFVIYYAGADRWTFAYGAMGEPLGAFVSALWRRVGEEERTTTELLKVVSDDDALCELSTVAAGRIEPIGSMGAMHKLLRKCQARTVYGHRLVLLPSRGRWVFVAWS